MDQYTILLVDDEPNILGALKRLFRSEHIAVMTASNGAEAIEILRRTTIQLLITDNKMPGISGIDLIKQVRNISPDTIRIILSGQSDMDAVLKAVNEGEAYRFVLKPWNDNEMKITVNIALAQCKLAADNKDLIKKLREKECILDYLRTNHPDLIAAIENTKLKDIMMDAGVEMEVKNGN